MRLIPDTRSFELITNAVDAVIDRGKALPSNVFANSLRHYSFVTFDDLLSAKYLIRYLRGYLTETGEANFWLRPINPDPADYYFLNFGIYNTFEFSIFDDPKDYVAALRDYPEESQADALMYNGQALLISSHSGQWAIYGERDANVAVCAFSSMKNMITFRRHYEFEFIADHRWAAEFAYKNAVNRSALMDEFRRSYSPVGK